MIIDDPDKFKAWLTAKLGPLCEADPEALAKYVYALVRKDKPIEELRASMVEQLEVFLQRETQTFVTLLFKTLETQNFELSTETSVLPPVSPVASKTSTVDVDLREQFSTQTSLEDSDKKIAKDSNSSAIVATIAPSAQNTNSLGNALLAASSRRETDKHVRKVDSDKDDRLPRRTRRRGSSPSPDRRRSRSRSFDRRRSRSRERERGRAWRNKSPPLRRYERSRRSLSKSPLPRRFSKSGSPQTKRISRRSYSKSPHRRYSKSRSPQSKRIRYRNRSPPHSRSRTRSRTRSRSPLGSRDRDRDRKDIGKALSPRENNHGDTDLRNIPSVVNLPPDLQSQFTRRCRDFDERGFCIRGDMCPYDHGTDPVVLEDVQVYNGGPAPAPLMSAGAPPPLIRHPVHPPMRPPPPVNLIEYNPDAPSMEPPMWGRPPPFRGPMMRGMMRGNMGRGGFPPHQRELINVVTGPHFRHQRPNHNLMDYANGRGNLIDPKSFDFNRLGGQRPPFNIKNGNASLQLRKVPPGVNNITHLNSHFSKFGKIVNIQVGFEGDPESALITFSSHTEANIAYKSTEAVLNNRFIRVFWLNPNNNNNITNNENKQENTPPTTRPSVLDRLGDLPTKVLNNIQPSAVQQEEKAQVTLGVNNTLSKTLYIPSAMKKEAPKETAAPDPKAQQKVEQLKKKIEEVAVAKKKQQESIKAGLKLNADLRKRKTELMEKQINQQKLLIQRMEAPNVTPQQKATLMDTIKTLQESIEKIRKDLESSIIKPALAKVNKTQVVKSHQALVKKTREETQRELLDAELDLINSQHEGKDAEELKKKVADLKLRALSLGLTATPTRGAFRGRVAVRIRGRGRGAKFTTPISYDPNVVDHRPTKVLVSGYEQDDKAEVLTHFEKYGQIVDYISDDATPSLVLNFKSRKEAENAINKGRNFHDRLLSVTWATSNMNIRGGVVTKPSTPVQRAVMVMEDDEIGEEILEDVDDDDGYVLLSPGYFPNDGELEEAEEEEGDEERSWRR